VVKRRRREENPKQGSKGMRDGYHCKTKEIFIARKRHGAIVTNVISIPARVVLKTMRRASVIQEGKQTVQLFR
jgi:hypothetical protein